MNCRTLAKKLIDENKLRAEGLAFKSHLSHSTVSKWLTGKPVKPQTESKLKAVLDEIQKLEQKAAG